MYESLADVGIVYASSMLVARLSQKNILDGTLNGHAIHSCEETLRAKLAPNIRLCARIPPYKVINQGEARPVHVADLLKNTEAMADFCVCRRHHPTDISRAHSATRRHTSLSRLAAEEIHAVVACDATTLLSSCWPSTRRRAKPCRI